MNDKDKIISGMYSDRAGYGSQRVTYQNANKRDASIAMQDVKEWFQDNVDRKKQVSGDNSVIAPNNYEYQLDLDLLNQGMV